LKSCSYKARLVTYEIQNKNTTNITDTHVGTNTSLYNTGISENYIFENTVYNAVSLSWHETRLKGCENM